MHVCIYVQCLHRVLCVYARVWRMVVCCQDMWSYVWLFGVWLCVCLCGWMRADLWIVCEFVFLWLYGFVCACLYGCLSACVLLYVRLYARVRVSVWLYGCIVCNCSWCTLFSYSSITQSPDTYIGSTYTDICTTCTEFEMTSAEDVFHVLEVGARFRSVDSHNLNSASSRSFLAHT